MMLIYMIRVLFVLFFVYTVIYLFQMGISLCISIYRLEKYKTNKTLNRKLFPTAFAKRIPVSVIIPAYNEAACITETIEALFEEDYLNLEIIVVDDGSNDNTESLVVKRFGLIEEPVLSESELKAKPILRQYRKVFDEKTLIFIRKVGTITPALARPLPDGGYELISGHRRLAACQVLGIETMPVIVREMSDDEAVIAMVDANLQRETILPSEKAFAYKMKLEAIKHQGKTSVQVAEKLLSVEKVAEEAGESKDQVRRYIRLTYLIPELLSMVDDNKIAFNPAVEISYLDRDEQLTLLDAINMNDCTPSHAQSIRLKKMSQDGLLTADAIYDILSEEKPNQKEQIKLSRDELRKYFPQNYSNEQIKRDILKGLELLKRQRERNRDAR